MTINERFKNIAGKLGLMADLKTRAEEHLGREDERLLDAKLRPYGHVFVEVTDKVAVFIRMDPVDFQAAYQCFGSTSQCDFAIVYDPLIDGVKFDLYDDSETHQTLTHRLARKYIIIDYSAFSHGSTSPKEFQRLRTKSEAVDDMVHQYGFYDLSQRIYVPRSLPGLCQNSSFIEGIEEPSVGSATEDRLAEMVGPNAGYTLKECLSDPSIKEPTPKIARVLEGIANTDRYIQANIFSRFGQFFTNVRSILDRHGLPYRKPEKIEENFRKFCEELEAMRLPYQVVDRLKTK